MSKEPEKKFEDLSDEEKAKVVRQHYYGTANDLGITLNNALVLSGMTGGVAASPHFRAIAGSSIIGASLEELKEHDAEAAKLLFQELASGLMAVGERLQVAQGEDANDDAA